MLRQEIYALDGTDARRRIPTRVTEQNFTIERLQPRGRTIAMPCSSPTRARAIELPLRSAIPADPRISHALTLEVDDFRQRAEIRRDRLRPPHADPDLSPQRPGEADAGATSPTRENGVTNHV